MTHMYLYVYTVYYGWADDLLVVFFFIIYVCSLYSNL